MADLRKTPDLLPAWHAEDWVRLLERAYEADGPKVTGERLGVSPAMVTGVVRGYYASSLDRIRTAVRETLAVESVTCPVLGEISLAECRAHRELPFAATNPLRVRLWRTCRSCPYNPAAEVALTPPR